MRLRLGILTALTLLAAPALSRDRADQSDGARTQHMSQPSWKHVDVKTKQRLPRPRGRRCRPLRGSAAARVASGARPTRARPGHKVGPELTKPLLFRDVEAVDADTAQILAIGPGRQSRIYRTTDGGATWARTFTNRDQAAFYDCMAMYPDGLHGLAMSDPVDGKFRIARTEDGGLTWSVVPRKGMPKAVEGEFGFAASGTCLVTAGDKHAYFASGGGDSRIFFSKDWGTTWKVKKSRDPRPPRRAGSSRSAFKDPKQGLAVGGDFTDPDNGERMSAYGAAPELDPWRRPRRLPLRRGLAARQEAGGGRRRPHRQRRHPRRWQDLEALRRGFVRRRRCAPPTAPAGRPVPRARWRSCATEDHRVRRTDRAPPAITAGGSRRVRNLTARSLSLSFRYLSVDSATFERVV